MNGKFWWLAVLTGKTLPHQLKSLENIAVRFATTHFGFQEVDKKEKNKKGMTFYNTFISFKRKLTSEWIC